jgi:hypothetical protein
MDPGQAHGLSFSVPRGVQAPPSLGNIYKEIQQDLGFPIPSHGNLEKWSREGVLLLNAMLTVEANQAASHQNKGWEQFTDAAIHRLNEQRSGIVFLLWGKLRQEKRRLHRYTEAPWCLTPRILRRFLRIRAGTETIIFPKPIPIWSRRAKPRSTGKSNKGACNSARTVFLN